MMILIFTHAFAFSLGGCMGFVVTALIVAGRNKR